MLHFCKTSPHIAVLCMTNVSVTLTMDPMPEQRRLLHSISQNAGVLLRDIFSVHSDISGGECSVNSAILGGERSVHSEILGGAFSVRPPILAGSVLYTLISWVGNVLCSLIFGWQMFRTIGYVGWGMFGVL